MIKKILVMLIFLAVFISGCGENGDVTEGPFLGGSDGVEISFISGAPLSEFSQEASVPVKLLLKNNGEFEIVAETAEVQLYGLKMDEYDLSGDYQVVTGGLRPVEKGLIEEGGEQTVEMGILTYSRSVSNFLETTLYSRICYPYRTQAEVMACAISRDIQQVEDNPVCDLASDKLISGSVSSGPVQITLFTEELHGADEVSFRIVVENSGIGDVYKYDSVCSDLSDPVVKAENENKVRLGISPVDITCSFLDGESNSGLLRLDDAGSKTVVCVMPVDGTSSYETLVAINLDYKYIESTSVDMRILEA